MCIRDRGEVLGLVGESGSGKSVTALAILGLLGPAAQVAGQILWRSAAADATAPTDLLRLAPETLRRLRGQQIAMIFQEPMTALNPVMTIGRQVAESAEAHSPSWTGRESKRRAIAAVSYTHLDVYKRQLLYKIKQYKIVPPQKSFNPSSREKE